MEEERTLKDEISSLRESLEKTKKIKKPRKAGIPFRARIKKSDLLRGYVTVEQIDDNRNITFKKVPIEDGTIKLGDTYHAVGEEAIFFHKGKPFLHQAKRELNPWDLSKENVTYGQKYVMAKMLKDQISAKKLGIRGGVIFWLVVVAIGAYYFLSRGGGG